MAVDCLALTAPLRRSFINVGRLSRNSLYLYGFVFLLLSSEFSYVSSQQNNSDFPYVCFSMDIRNSLDEFKKLENCTVIEGFLQVLLFDNVNHTELSRIQFPKLTEITDYLLMYRVNGLRSIGQLFPNLALIRGQNQFLNNAALTIFEMSSLQEIGLYSLTEISQGVVHIDKNPSLCFVHTIDWDRIIREKKGSFIKSLKPENECPVCPSMITQETSDGQSINSSCHIAPRTNSDGNGKDKYLCWNKHHCQKICPSNCTGGCNYKGDCCHTSCISCSNDDPNLCLVCKNLTMGDGKDKQCMTKCPNKYLRFLERRCITREECINKDKPIEIHPTIEIEKPYKVFNNEHCVLNCPNNYMASYETHECKPCGGTCRKECDGINIDSITVVKTLRGCTHIKGPLEIQIRGGAKVVSELEDNLSMIEEISGYLKIVRSFSLISLNFFKSLKRIKGEIQDSNKYVFIVLDNQNLQELFSDNRTLEINDGKLFFHFNPKLCYSKITSLQQLAKLDPPSELEVAKNSNGDKIACDVEKLDVRITKILDKAVVLEWKKFVMDDMRKLLAYTVYCIEAPYSNITEYDRRDACGLDDWHVYDVTYAENEKVINHILPNLKPYTQYAFYVKTYTVASEPRGAKSDLNYFITRPSIPSHPTHLRITSNSSDSLIITWGPPNQPNGKITHYMVAGRLRKYAYPYSKERNYCKDPPTISLPPEDRFTITTPSPKSSNETCTCDEKENQRISIDESEELQRIKFEDELHNQVYQKRVPDMRRKRDADDLFTGDITSIKNSTTEKGTWQTFLFPVFGKTEFYINKLHHYTSYEVHVIACREKEVVDHTDHCSPSSSHTLRTMQKPDADNIYKVQITNQSLDSVLVSWEQPDDPNGVILTYTIEYQRIDNDHSRVPYSSPHPLCINKTNDLNRTVSYPITRLTPGNYSLRVMATSSANSGAYSHYVYFYIEKPTSNTVVIVCIIIFVALTIIIFAGWMYRKYLKKEKAKHRINLSINPEYIPSVYVPDEWEVSRDKIELIKELGQGSFGVVWEGIAKDIKGKSEIKCAVKTVNEHAADGEGLEFLDEASVMKAFDTTHVVRLLGVVSQGQPALVIMELMANGDLKSYLRSHRPDVENYDPNLKSPPTLRQILQMAIEIADGMAYLAAKKFVHRDLAARNCMVSEDLTVKIGDFGMTRDIYETDYYRKGTKGLLPVRWMAPESLKDGVFTSSSDVWSYGVVLWEMATLASQPYQGLSNDQVLRYVIDGGVMERPENCPDRLYTLMGYCWQPKPTSRPTFLKLCQLLLDDASPNFAQVSFYNSPAGVEARAARTTPSPVHTEDPAATPLRSSAERLQGYMPSDSQESDEMEVDTHHRFPSMSEARVVLTATASYCVRFFRKLEPRGRGFKVYFITYNRRYFHKSYFESCDPDDPLPLPELPKSSSDSSSNGSNSLSPGTETFEMSPLDPRREFEDSHAGTSRDLPQIIEIEESLAGSASILLQYLEGSEPQAGTSDLLQNIELEEVLPRTSNDPVQIIELDEPQPGTSQDTAPDLLQFIFIPGEEATGAQETSENLPQSPKLAEGSQGTSEYLIQLSGVQEEEETVSEKESQELSEYPGSSAQSLDHETSEQETPTSSELLKVSGTSQKDSESLEASTTDESPEEHQNIPTTEALI